MVTVYSKPACVQCVDTKSFLKKIGVNFTEVDLSRDPDALDNVLKLGYRSAPVVVTDNDSWAGFRKDKLQSLVSSDDWDSVFA